jgi:crossover junction endodeoxyribonuclease RusA
MNVTLPYPPSANRYWRSVGSKVLRSREAAVYRQQVGWLCNTEGVTPVSGEVSVTLNVYRPQRSGDLDNRIKVTLDALKGFAFADDDQVVELHAYRHDDKDNPRIEVIVTEL